MTQAASNKVMGGSQILVFINGFPWGNCRSIRLRIVNTSKKLFGLDSAFPFDNIPTTIQVDGTIELYKLVGDGGLEGQEITAPPLLVQNSMFASIILINRISQEVIFRSDTCLVQSQDWDIPSRGIISGSVGFTAIDWTSDGIQLESTI